MSLIRPEVRAGLWRARELVTGVGVSALALYLATETFGLTRWLFYVILVASLVFAFAGWQRMRLRPRDQGQGVVEVTEGQISYFGPLDGGIVAHDALLSVALDHGNRPATWVLSQSDGTRLHIPVNAAGQDNLLDALNSLPGLSAAALLHALNAQDGQRHILWSAPRRG